MGNTSPTTTLFSDVRALVEATRQRVALSVNAELTQLYWQIGPRINTELHQSGGTE
ncbi:DUF1016 domain-containing protein [Hymenobacter setariae]|uniref:DUF1016 domain-containing protein n=1 Tax=Hymenobacter setariae TaxID=2594794 RepID=A0A558BKC3_9BACT|nr:DUF1016 family protein [Hymenobacter setariae]TVT36933.1 DUF1016 domain-containing protein [Hymenobacter setariae]